MKLLLGVVLLVASLSATAQNCDNIKSLSIDEATKVSLQKQCLDASIANKTNPQTVIENISKGDVEEFRDKATVVVESVTSMIKNTAGELNIAVNEFVKTPVGIITTGILVYHFVGKEFIIWMKDFLFLTLFLVLSHYILYKIRLNFLLKSEEMVEKKGWFGSVKTVKVRTYYTWENIYSEGTVAWYILTVMGQIAATIIYFVNV